MSHPETLELIPLGGLGQFGMNSMLYRVGDDALLIDAGMMFPALDEPGVERVLPDFAPLADCGRLHGVVATHGHEDHIGAIPDLLSRHPLPVIASRYTTELIRRRLPSAAGVKFVRLGDEPLSLGPFTIEALACPHSIPGACMLVVQTPAGCVVHTGDFKLDRDSPDGVALDLERLSELGDAGVLALLSDSTNADCAGSTPGERSLEPAFEAILAGCDGRVVVTTFASHALRLRMLGRLAARHGRHLAILGAAMESHADIAESQGQLPLPRGTRISNEYLMQLPRGRLLVAASGSQGEPQSAMARIAQNEHRQLQLEAEDLVVHSARIIPGNGKQIGNMFDDLARRGARVIAAADAAVHVSGHASADELSELIRRVRPRYLIPIHGEYRQLAAHARLARDAGFPAERTLLAESGDCIVVNRRECFVDGKLALLPRLIDPSGAALGAETIRERLRMAREGIVVPIVDGARSGAAVAVVARGFAPLAPGGSASLHRQLRSIVSQALETVSDEELKSPELLGARIDRELKRLFRRETDQRPLVVSTVLER